jgi:D-inositol-3-phosphate glycosyltransferase
VRILFVTHYALPHVGGVEVVVDQLSRELGRRGHQVDWLAAGVDDAPERLDTHCPDPSLGADLHAVPAWNAIEHRTGLPYPLFGPTFVATARRLIANADVVHAHGFLFQSSAIALALAARRARKRGRPARVLTEHGGRGSYSSAALRAVESVVIESVGRISLHSAQAVVSLNSRIEEFVRELVPRRRIVTILNGVDTQLYRPPEQGERESLRKELGWDDKPRVLFVGRLVPRKGADIAVAAVAGALLDRAELVLAGPGALQSTPSNVQALGSVPPDRIAQLYRAADCFLLPSTAEGFPLTAQEALASGLPVVLAEDPSYAPYLDGAPAGMVTIDRTADAVTQALLELDCGRSIDESQRAELAEFARSRFSWGECAEAHLRLYEELGAGGHPHA